MPKRSPQHEREVATIEKVRLEAPRLFEVVLHNDDYTTQVFVVYVLMKFFHHDAATANEIMLSVHTKGTGVAGIYPRDIAETKAQQVVTFARQHEMPLECSVRKQSC
jgi:ATP-dependent Clp protease adaptor protein ClpS